MRTTLRAAIAVLACAGTTAAQQAVVEFQHQRRVAPNERMVATVDTTVGSVRRGGYGWVRVEIHNPDDQKHRVDIELRDRFSRSPAFAVRRSFVLGPSATAVDFLPVPGVGRQSSLSIVADDFDSAAARVTIGENNRATGIAPLLISDHVEDATAWLAMMQVLTAGIDAGQDSSWSGGRHVTTKREAVQRLPHRAVADLPNDWRMLTGFDFVLLDGRSQITPEAQQMLLEYVRTGGHVCLFEADNLDADSMLRRAWPGAGTSVVAARDGFGSWLALDGDTSAGLPASLPDLQHPAILAWFDHEHSDVLGMPAHGSGPVPSHRHWTASIPGLDELPRGAFLVLLLLFAFFAGPFNYFYWQRKRQLPMLLLTVPLAGFGMTGAILLFGLLAEGLGVQGIVESVTMLDQREHRAVSWSRQKVFAGITPDEIRPAAGTYLCAGDLLEDPPWNRQRPHRLEIDWNRGWSIDGGLVPSRYVTSLHTATIGTERERLRFRQRPDGGLECLDSPELALAPSSNSSARVLLRDFEGNYHVGSTDGKMRRIPPDSVSSYSRPLLGPWGEGIPVVSARTWVDDMPAGSYLAWTSRAPGFDGLGLDTEWHAPRHVVIGLLAEEDVIFD